MAAAPRSAQARGTTMTRTGTTTGTSTTTTWALLSALAVAATLTVAGCAGAGELAPRAATPTSGGATARSEEPVDPPLHSSPPPVTVRGIGGPVDLEPWTWCWSGPTSGGCADGAPPEELSDVGAAGQVAVSFPEPGWTFTAAFRPADQPCAREQRGDLQVGPTGLAPSTSGGVITPAGPAGTYDVDVSGRGAGGNDVITTFRWTTSVDGPAPAPDAAVDLLEEHDGVEGHGLSLAVTGLAASPGQARAHVVVTSSEGASLALDPGPEVGSCSSEGSVWFYGSSEEGQQAAALGSAPFTYDVTLVLDGVEHRARAVWPADETASPGENPSVPLRFAPPLPAVVP